MRITEVSELADTPDGELVEACSVLHHPVSVVVAPTRALEKSSCVRAARALRRLPAPTILVVDDPAVEDRAALDALTSAADVCLSRRSGAPRPWVSAQPDELDESVGSQPLAALALVILLRTTERLCTWDAVAQESVTYSMLLGSVPFLRWLNDRPRRRTKRSGTGVVKVERRDRVLTVTLDRPEARNAIDSEVRDGLVEAFRLAALEPEMRIELRGTGPCFSSGGDLDEFGTVRDAATAHAVRLTRHPGLALSEVSSRTTSYLHGSCIGAGVEIPAFAEKVIADPKTTFALPEVTMGLVPGAGGTVSIRRRIGRQRTAWLVLTGATLDCATALEWGLVDAVNAAEFAAT